MIDDRLLIKQLLSQCNQDRSLAKIIFDKLFEEVPEQLRQIEMAMQSNDLSSAEKTTHTLHGSIRFCGFKAFQDDAKALESALQKQDLQTSRHYYRILHRKLTNFLNQRDTIQQLLEHKKSP